VLENAGQIVVKGVQKDVLEVFERQRMLKIAADGQRRKERSEEEGRQHGRAEQCGEYPEEALDEKRKRLRIVPAPGNEKTADDDEHRNRCPDDGPDRPVDRDRDQVE
jgi:hypothetical protein